MGKTRKQARLTRGKLLALLANWNTLNGALMRLSEEEVGLLLAHERSGKNRLSYTLRLHARLTRLRSERERRGLAASAGRNVALPPGE